MRAEPGGVRGTEPSGSGITAVSDVRQLASTWLRDAPVPGLALVIGRPGEAAHDNHLGYADLAQSTPVSPQTRFRLGSLSKILVTVATLRLIGSGHLELDASVNSYLRVLRVRPSDSSRPVSIRHLLSHTSGLGDWKEWRELLAEQVRVETDRRDGACAGIALPRTLRARSRAGSRWAYSNPAFDVLARVVEDVTGEDYFGHVRRTIIEPLALRHTGFHGVDTGERHQTAIALGYEQDDHGRYLESPPPDLELLPALGAVSTAGDLCRLALSVMSDADFLRPDLRELMFRETFAVHPRLPQQCLWLWRARVGRRDVWWHDGFVGGFSTALYLVPDESLVVVILTNGATHKVSEELGPAVLERILNDAGPASGAGSRPRTGRRADLAGVYRYPGAHPLEPRPEVAVHVDDDGVVWLRDLTERHGIPLREEGDDPLLFRAKSGPEGTVLFLQDADGRVSGLCLESFMVFVKRRCNSAWPRRLRTTAEWALRVSFGLLRSQRNTEVSTVTTVRLMEAADVTAVLTLWNENARQATGRDLAPQETAAVERHLQLNLAHERAFCLVATTDRLVIGFVTGHLLAHSTYPGVVGMVEELFVAGPLRQRMSEQLVTEALDHLRAGGADHFRIEVAPDDREDRRLFQALGWEPSLLIYSFYDSFDSQEQEG